MLDEVQSTFSHCTVFAFCFSAIGILAAKLSFYFSIISNFVVLKEGVHIFQGPLKAQLYELASRQLLFKYALREILLSFANFVAQLTDFVVGSLTYF